MAIFKSLKILISRSLRNNSSFAPTRAFFSVSISAAHSPTPTPTPSLLPGNGYIRRHFLFRSRFLSPALPPRYPSNPPWKLLQSATPLLLRSDFVQNFLKLRALNLLHQRAFPYNIEYDARRLFLESGREEFGEGAEIGASVGDDGISDSYLNLPNLISFARMLSGPVLGCVELEGLGPQEVYEFRQKDKQPYDAKWMILHDMYPYVFIGLAVSGATDWLDGYVARKMKINSVVGSYLDPLADKVLIGCVAVTMVERDLLHQAGLVAIVVLRDVALVGGAIYKRASSLDWKWNSWHDFFNLNGAHAQKIEPLLISKVNTVFQLALVAAALLQPGFGNEETQLYINLLNWLVVSTTVASTVAYGVQNWRNRAALMKNSEF
ncbi:hypothetical protein OROGR_001152 [Orobanche gracilis]